MTEEIPRLYETEPTPLEAKIIHRHYYLPEAPGFFWLVAEYDPDQHLAFGYACLNDPDMAEWGFIDLTEVDAVGAVLNPDWQPCSFQDALRYLARGDQP